MRKLTLLAAAAFAATAVPASATITFGTQSVSQGEEVLFNPGMTGTSVTGLTNQTDTSVTFSTLTGQTLSSTQSQGQARIEAYDGTTQIDLNSLLIQLTDLTNPEEGFGYIEFNIDETGQLGSATTVTINAVDQNGNPFSTSSAVGSGSNFFSALASGGEVIRSISFNTGSSHGFTDIRQIRITPAVGGQQTIPLPEPGTWAMMLLGFGAAGVSMRRSRRRKALLTQIA